MLIQAVELCREFVWEPLVVNIQPRQICATGVPQHRVSGKLSTVVLIMGNDSDVRVAGLEF